MIDLEKKEDGEQTGSRKTSGAVGVSININLLGYEVREEIEKSISGVKLSKSIIVSLLLLGVSIIIVAIGYITLVSLRDEQVELKQQLESRKAELQAKDKELTELTATKDKYQKKRDILAWAAGDGLKWSSLLEEIRNRIPSNLWVDKIDINDGKVIISGETFDHKTVALFLANLQDSTTFKDVKLDFTKKTTDIKLRDIDKLNQAPSKKSMNVEREINSITKFNIRFEIVR